MNCPHCDKPALFMGMDGLFCTACGHVLTPLEERMLRNDRRMAELQRMDEIREKMKRGESL